MTRPRTKTHEGDRIQPMLPVHLDLFGAVAVEAGFTKYDGVWCVEASVKLGMLEMPYTLVLTIAQAREADLIEREE